MKAKSIKGKSTQEIQSALQQAMSDGFKPTLAFVFISIKQDRIAICELFNQEGIEVFGSTTAGEFTDGEIGKESVAIMLLDMNRNHFKIIFKETKEANTKTISRSIGEAGLQLFSNPAFLIACDGFSTNVEIVIEGIEEIVGPDVNIFGGMAGDDLTTSGTFVFTHKNVTTDGIVALIIDQDKIKITGLATHGWQPVGTVRTITKSEGNTVYTIDDEPALDMFMKYMGAPVDSSQKMTYNFGDYYPIQLLKNNAPSIMREVRAINTMDRSILFSAPVHQGSTFRFSLPPDWNIIDKITGDCHHVKNENSSEVDAVIVFSCVARLLSLGPMINKEVEQINKVWESPMIGFFTYGEIGKNATGRNELHNNTCMITLLKEK